jgi:hypothetical protein
LSRLRRPIAVLAVLIAGAGLAACGKHADENARVQKIENEGLYLSLGPLKYQVQLSRQLNPNDIQDRYLLRGVPPAEQNIAPDEVWFGVFLQVENESSKPLQPSGDIQIIDTQDERFTPLTLEDSNLFAYRASEPIPSGEILPIADTPGYDTPIRGAMLLFKLKGSALDNRPLELEIQGSTTPKHTGIIDLDV